MIGLIKCAYIGYWNISKFHIGATLLKMCVIKFENPPRMNEQQGMEMAILLS